MQTKFWSENLKGKITLGRPSCRLEYNIRMDLREIVWKGMDLIYLAQDRDQWQVVVNTMTKVRVP
jgi:hypothetical protein